jgi:hypothetical protein
VTLQIFCDDNLEGNWFRSLCTSLNNIPLNPIRSRGQNPPYIEKLLRYDVPDIILVENEVPKLILEKTREVPTGHNVGQRFGRLVNAAEEGVMVIFFLPFIARKHGKHSSVCYIPARLFTALQKMEVIHQVPVLAINWPSDSSYELMRDNSESVLVAQLINELIANKFDYPKCKKIDEIRILMTERIQKCMKSTADPPTSVKVKNTKMYFAMLEKYFPSDYVLLQSIIKNRPKSVIYQIGMTEEKCRRTDPYTDPLFSFMAFSRCSIAIASFSRFLI